MGSLISGVIERIVLQRLEKEVLLHCPPKFWARYGGDTFIVLEREKLPCSRAKKIRYS